ncbi:YadA-like family protein [Paraburkholderia kururiensis]|uniref:YadA-like family protein n=1 Tax=Paraburkholderia kururiensis TaxID=984307 RepID=UPI0018F2CF54|nr:YadA-like family protein [Paraburkholderia kururiensis]
MRLTTRSESAYGATASSDSAIAIGRAALAQNGQAVSIGVANTASGNGAVAIGDPNVATGTGAVALGANPIDAVNVQQLTGVQSSVNSVARAAYTGIAAATALRMIPEVDPGKTLAIGIGTGNYHGYSAAALGFTARITENLKSRVA